MRNIKYLLIFISLVTIVDGGIQGQTSPEDIKFVRQGVRRLIFDEDQSIPLAGLEPEKIIGLSVMHPIKHYLAKPSETFISDDKLVIQSDMETQTGIWFGGFNPFATYSIDLASCEGEGDIGFEFSDAEKTEQFIITVGFNNASLTGVNLSVFDQLCVSCRYLYCHQPGRKRING